MYFIYAAVCAVLCIATGSAYNLGPLNTTAEIGTMNVPSIEHVTASRNLIGLLEYLRRLMPVGIADTVPPMDPYVRESLPPVEFNTSGSPLSGEVELSNLVVSGAKEFVIRDISVQIDSEMVEFEITVPKLVADFDYLTTNFVFNETLALNMSGHVQVTLENLHLNGALSAAVLIREEKMVPFYVVTGLHVTNTVDNVQTEVNLSMVPTDIIDEIKDMLFKSVAKAAQTQMNHILIRFSDKQVLKFLEKDISPYDHTD